MTFTVWDVGGQEKIRRLWKHYYANNNGLFYVVDSTDVERIKESAEELHGIIEFSEMHGVPVVILANKQDLPNARSCSDLIKDLNLVKLSATRNEWIIQGCCAVTGEGLFEGMKSMSDLIKQNK